MWLILMEKHDLDLIYTQSSGLTLSDEEKDNGKRKYFITYQSYFSIEMNAHSLTYLSLLVSEGQLPLEALHIWLQNSQTCESTFRSARSISNVNSAGVNFTVLEFLNRIKKLSTLQKIKNNTNENKLRFPQHHKILSTSHNNSKSSNTTTITKTDIENTVLNAYEHITELFKSLNINQLSRNGQTISIKELSDTISRRLDAFWTTINDDSKIKNSYLDTESDDETDSDLDNDVTCDYNSDEEVNLYDNYDTIHNVTTTTNQGIRLFDHIKEELAQNYFQVLINGNKKHLHKQSACWLLAKEKNSLSSDRTSRVQGK
jgi:hypothetical protein